MQVSAINNSQTNFTARTRILKSVVWNGKKYNLREFISKPGTRQVAQPGWIKQLYLTEERKFMGIPLPDKVLRTKATVVVDDWIKSILPPNVKYEKETNTTPKRKPYVCKALRGYKRRSIVNGIGTLRYSYTTKYLSDIRNDGTIKGVT